MINSKGGGVSISVVVSFNLFKSNLTLCLQSAVFAPMSVKGNREEIETNLVSSSKTRAGHQEGKRIRSRVSIRNRKRVNTDMWRVNDVFSMFSMNLEFLFYFSRLKTFFLSRETFIVFFVFYMLDIFEEKTKKYGQYAFIQSHWGI